MSLFAFYTNWTPALLGDRHSLSECCEPAYLHLYQFPALVFYSKIISVGRKTEKLELHTTSIKFAKKFKRQRKNLFLPTRICNINNYIT